VATNVVAKSNVVVAMRVAAGRIKPDEYKFGLKLLNFT